MIKAILLIIITIFIPPIGAFAVAGCGVDLLINILLTILGYFPGHIHAFYLEYIYFKRRDEVRAGTWNGRPAPGVYSQKVQMGGHRGGVVVPPQGQQQAPVPVQQGLLPQGYPVQGQGQQGYGTVN